MEDSNGSDIYADLPKFRFGDGLEELQANNRNLNKEIIQLNATLAQITKEKDEYQSKCATLTNNISSLLKTAQAEIQRKDKLIKELRTQIADSSLNHYFRKRRSQDGSDYCQAKRNTCDFLAERDKVAVNNSSSKRTSENTHNESKNISLDKNRDPKSNKESDTKTENVVCTKNGERNLSLPNSTALPPSGKCKTLYSQRMFNKLQSLPSTNGFHTTAPLETKEVKRSVEETKCDRNSYFTSESVQPECTKADIRISEKVETPMGNVDVDHAAKALFQTNRVNKISNCSKPLNDKQSIRENVVRKGESKTIKVDEQAHGVVDEAAPVILKNNTSSDRDVEPELKSLKGLPSIEVPSDKVHNLDNVKERSQTPVKENITEKDIVFRELQSSQTNLQIVAKESKSNALDDFKSDSSKFLRPISSKVIKKPNKKLILPISKNWNGLVKTVDKENYKECGEEHAKVITNDNKPKMLQDVTLCNGESANQNDPITPDQHTTDKNNLVEHLFGSPLKWTDNSNESIPVLELNSPAVYEDSCSAHIENTKFNLTSAKTFLQNPKPNFPRESDNGNSSIKTCKEGVDEQKDPIILPRENMSLNNNQPVRAFEEVGGNKQRTKSLFSPMKSDSCKSSSILNLNRDSSVELSINFPFKSRYEDSVLGQFDDTTQFVSALTKVESKISPLNTPVKSALAKPTCASSNLHSNNLEEKVFPQAHNTLISGEVGTLIPLVNNKSMNDKPINILYPRKTPRIVTYSKTKEEKVETKHDSATDTPNKSNRFAINDAFISQQEEKVLRISKSNIIDPIAITISAKSKIKGKESHLLQSPQKKGTQIHSPRKTKLTSLPASKKSITKSPKNPNKCLINANNLLSYNGLNSSQNHTLRNNGTASIEKLNNNSETEIFPLGARRSLGEAKQNQIKAASPSHGVITDKVKKDEELLLGNDVINNSSFPTDRLQYERKEENEDLLSDDRKTDSFMVVNNSKGATSNNTKYMDCNEENKLKGFPEGARNYEYLVSSETAKGCDQLEEKSRNKDTQTVVKPNSVCKGNTDRLRINNFKPSSQLKKPSRYSQISNHQENRKRYDTPGKPVSVRHVEKNALINNGTPEKIKLDDIRRNSGGNRNPILTNDPRKSPNVIVRSSKKPEFVSTTLLDDVCSSPTSVKSPKSNSREPKEIKIREWILRPITFDTEHRPYHWLKTLDDPKEVSHPSSKVDLEIRSSDKQGDNMNKPNNINSLPSRRKVSNGSNIETSPKKIIRARRPLNFGIKVTLD